MIADALDGSIFVTLLGGFELSLGGRTIELPIGSQQLVAFVALAALAGRRVGRCRVAGTLWSDSPTQHAQGSLRSALWRLRVQAPGLVIPDRMSLRLAPCVHVDLFDAMQLADRLLDPTKTGPEDLSTESIQLLSRDLLPDWYEDWAIAEMERWRQYRSHALEALGHALLRERRNAEAVLAGLAAVECDPFRESGQAVVIEAFAAQEKYVEAKHHYDAYRSLLLAELGVEPPPRLRGYLVAGA